MSSAAHGHQPGGRRRAGGMRQGPDPPRGARSPKAFRILRHGRRLRPAGPRDGLPPGDRNPLGAPGGFGDRRPGPQAGQLAADGKFTVPVVAIFPLEDWRAAMDISRSGQARGKLLLLP